MTSSPGTPPTTQTESGSGQTVVPPYTSAKDELEKNALYHGVEVIFANDPTVVAAFQYFDIKNILGFLMVTTEDFAGEEYTYLIPGNPPQSITKKLTKVQLRLLQLLNDWATFSEGGHTASEWNLLTRATLQQFKLNQATNPFTNVSQIPSPQIPETSFIHSPTSVMDPPRHEKSFFETIKISLNDFKDLSSDSNWHEYHRNLKATATAHRCSEVLDLSYNPNTPYEVKELKDKSTYMYSVFLRTLKTNKSKKHVRKYEVQQDGRAVYRALVAEYKAGTDADLERYRLETKIRDYRINNRGKTSYQDFFNQWENTLLELELVMGSTVTDENKRRWITEAVRDNTSFNTILVQHSTTLLTYRHLASLYSPHVASNHLDYSNDSQIPNELPFEVLFSSLVNHAKLLDDSHSSRQKDKPDNNNNKGKNKEQQNSNKNNSNGNKGNNNHNKNGNNQYKWETVPPEKWNKMSQAEKDKHLQTQRKKKAEFNAKKKGNNNSNNNQGNNATRQVNSTNVTPASTQSAAPSGNNQPSGTTMKTMLSNAIFPTKESQANPDFVIGNKTYHVNMARILVNSNSTTEHGESLIDRGANAGFAGNDVMVLATGTRTVDVQGVNGTIIKGKPIGTAAGYVESTAGPVIAILQEYALYQDGPSVHSSVQLEHFGLDVDERPRALGGRQSIKTPDGFELPLKSYNGLSYMPMRPPTIEELHQLPHVILTSNVPWNPAILNDSPENNPELEAREINVLACVFEAQAINPQLLTFSQPELDKLKLPTSWIPKSILPSKPNYEKLRPLFAWATADRIRDTLKVTTQWYQAEGRIPMRKHFKSRFPAANVRRVNEVVATDTFFSDTPAYSDGIPGHAGVQMLQLYVGVNSHYIAVYPMKAKSNMPNTLKDYIRDIGAPDALFSDNAAEEVSALVVDILRHYNIVQQLSEGYHQHQNKAERTIQEVKLMINVVLDRTGTPATFWLLCAKYCIYVLNRLARQSTDMVTPYEKAFHVQPDISVLLQFRWWEPVYYRVENPTFPSDSIEKLGRFVGVAEKQGDVLTFLVLSQETMNVVARSSVRSAVTGPADLRAKPGFDNSLPLGGEIYRPADDDSSVDSGETRITGNPPPYRPPAVVNDLFDYLQPGVDPNEIELPRFSPEELIGKTFLRQDPDNADLQYKGTVDRVLRDLDADENNRIKFLCTVGDTEEIIAYNNLSHLVEKYQEANEESEDTKYTFSEVLNHEGPLTRNHANYKGSSYNVLVKWDDGTESWEPLAIIAKDDPLTCAKYAEEHGLLNYPGWKKLRGTLQRGRTQFSAMATIILNARGKKPNPKKVKKPKGKGKGKRFQFNVEIPNGPAHALALDKRNGNNLWGDAMKHEREQLDLFKTFKNLGHRSKVIIPHGYKCIPYSWVFAVKQDGRHRARLVAGGHKTDPNSEDAYSGVIMNRTQRIVIIYGVKNALRFGVGDIGNAYLTALTKEMVVIIAGPEFGPLEGCILLVYKALYGLRTSGARFHESLADTLRDMGFFPCRSDPDLWIRDAGDVYEYVCVYVDDLMAIMKNPDAFFEELNTKYGYKLKGCGEPSYYLGGDFFYDPDGTLVWGAKTYIKRMLDNVKHMCGEDPRPYTAPLEDKDSPELDETELLDDEGIKQYQSLIGALQWCVTLGRFDVAVSVMTMGRFRACPRVGHLQRLLRICGYLKKFPDGGIRFRTGTPKHEDNHTPVSHDWAYSVYGDSEEEVDPNSPIPKGEPMRLTTFVDANLMHCKVTGRSATGVFHLVDQTPVAWFSKRQSTVETATYGSEFVAARQATEQIMDIRILMRDMGIRIDGPTWLFGDNNSVITSGTMPSSMLNKRHNALAYHRVRSAIAAKVMYFLYVPSTENIADVLTKFLPFAKFWHLIKPFLFWRGDTSKMPDYSEEDTANENG